MGWAARRKPEVKKYSNFQCSKCYGTKVRGYRIDPISYFSRLNHDMTVKEKQELTEKCRIPIPCKCTLEEEKSKENV